MINVVCLITRSIEMIKHLYEYYLSNSRPLSKSGDTIVDLLTQIRNSVPFWVSNISFESKFGNLCFETHIEYCICLHRTIIPRILFQLISSQNQYKKWETIEYRANSVQEDCIKCLAVHTLTKKSDALVFSLSNISS